MSETTSEVTQGDHAIPAEGTSARYKWESNKWRGFLLATISTVVLSFCRIVDGEVFGWTVTGLFSIYCGANVAQKRILGS